MSHAQDSPTLMEQLWIAADKAFATVSPELYGLVKAIVIMSQPHATSASVMIELGQRRPRKKIRVKRKR